MEAKAIITYVICSDTLKFLNHKDDVQAKMSCAEIMTTAILAASEYSGNIDKAINALCSPRYFPNMLSKSQFNRKLHSIKAEAWNAVLAKISAGFTDQNPNREYIIDSFPLRACRLSRRGRNKMYTEKKFLGFCAAHQEYFIGLKLHMICDIYGNPVQFILLPASISDISGLKQINLNLPNGAVILADKAYNDYDYEDWLVSKLGIHLLSAKKKNSKRKGGGYFAKIRAAKRKMIESAFSCIEKLMPRSIHAVTKAGFELKSTLFLLAYAVSKVSF